MRDLPTPAPNPYRPPTTRALDEFAGGTLDEAMLFEARSRLAVSIRRLGWLAVALVVIIVNLLTYLSARSMLGHWGISIYLPGIALMGLGVWPAASMISGSYLLPKLPQRIGDALLQHLFRLGLFFFPLLSLPAWMLAGRLRQLLSAEPSDHES